MRDPVPATEDTLLLERLRHGDAAAYAEVVAAYHDALVTVALAYVRRRSVAEEVVQETWIAVVRGLDRFEGRSSLRSWIFRIVRNRAITVGTREARCLPSDGIDDSDDALHTGSHMDDPERRLIRHQAWREVERALDQLPARQGRVVRLRDLEDRESDEVSATLGVSRINQRVLLHRGRLKVRDMVGADTLQLLAS